MLPFELTAIDAILVIAVIILMILHLKDIKSPDKILEKLHKEKQLEKKQVLFDHNNKCPRGFGEIRIIDENNTISERCLQCYQLTKCYIEKDSSKNNITI